MENTDENVRLNIETVTPETDNEGQPNDQKFNHRVENEASQESDEKPEADKPEGTGEKEPYAIYEKTDGDSSENGSDEDDSNQTDDSGPEDKVGPYG
jgi:hypothetical protein